MKSITVFTPTFNRAHLLPRLYKSLCDQTSKDFLWLIIDDGSTDETVMLVDEWILENKIQIQYVYKENGGMHTGHNLAYSLIKTELNICIDSDDYIPDNAVDEILNRWINIKDTSKIAGIVGLNANKKGEIIGTKIPDHLIQGSLHSLYKKYNVTGDKKLILRTKIVKEYPTYPEYKGEKLVPLGLLYLMIGKDYDFVYSNEVYCIVEYQLDGSSQTIFKQYKQSPKGFAYGRRIKIANTKDSKSNFKEYTHLISSAFFAKDFSLAFKGVNPFISFLALPFGILLHVYILLKIKD
jgi:glycosyltransferase involved in cell wall biosynthesis